MKKRLLLLSLVVSFLAAISCSTRSTGSKDSVSVDTAPIDTMYLPMNPPE